MPPHSFTNIEITQYYQNETRFIGIFSRNNFFRDEYKDSGTHWIASFCNKKQIIYFDSFGVEHVSKEILNFIGNKTIASNIYCVQTTNSILCGYFCILFINFMFVNKTLHGFTSLFSPWNFKLNDKIILTYF